MSRLAFKSELHKGRLGLNPTNETIREREEVEQSQDLEFTMEEDPVRNYWNEIGLLPNSLSSLPTVRGPLVPIDHNVQQRSFHGGRSGPQAQGGNGCGAVLAARRNGVSFYLREFVIISFWNEILIFERLKVCYDEAIVYQGRRDMDDREWMERHRTIQPDWHVGYLHNAVGVSTVPGRVAVGAVPNMVSEYMTVVCLWNCGVITQLSLMDLDGNKGPADNVKRNGSRKCFHGFGGSGEYERKYW